MGPRAGLDGGKSRRHRDLIPDRPAPSQSLYRLSYPAHIYIYMCVYIYIYMNTQKHNELIIFERFRGCDCQKYCLMGFDTETLGR